MRWLIVVSLLAGCARPRLAIVGDSAKLRAGDPLPATSAIFDGETVALVGARGETLGFQVLTHRRDQVSVEVDGPARVDAFAIRYLEVREPSTAMYGPSRGPGAWPDPLQPAALPVAGDAFFDVVIPRDAAPGRYAGVLRVGRRAIALTLTIVGASIDLASDPLVWIWYRPDEIAHAHGVADDDAVLLPIEEKYHALVRAHGAYLATDPAPARWQARRKFMAGTRYWPVWLDPEALGADADAWDRRFADLPATAFTIPVDEPHTPGERAEARRQAAAIGPHKKLLRAVTAAPSPDDGGAFDVYIHAASRAPHRWMYNGQPPAAGNMILDTDGTALRTWGWIAVRYGVELWYAWEGTYYADRYNGGAATDVLREPLTFDQRRARRRYPDWGNGDGVLVYPGPWPSLRLKALRRGLQDRLLLLALARRDPAASLRAARELVPRALDEGSGAAAWPRDDAPWEAARQRLYQALGYTRPR